MDCMNESFTADLQPAALHKLMGYRAALYQGYNDEFCPEAFHRFVLENPVGTELITRFITYRIYKPKSIIYLLLTFY